MTKLKKAEAKKALEIIASNIAQAFNIESPETYSDNHISGWEWRFDTVQVWTKAGHAKLSVEIDSNILHMYFCFDDVERAEQLVGDTGRLNPHSGKWNQCIWIAGDVGGVVKLLKSDFERVAEPNPSAEEIQAWNAKEAERSAYWAKCREEFANK